MGEIQDLKDELPVRSYGTLFAAYSTPSKNRANPHRLHGLTSLVLRSKARSNNALLSLLTDFFNYIRRRCNVLWGKLRFGER